VSGYIGPLQNFVQRYFDKKVELKDQEKKEFTKVIAQVQCKKPHIKNFMEDNMKLFKVQNYLLTKIEEKVQTLNTYNRKKVNTLTQSEIFGRNLHGEVGKSVVKNRNLSTHVSKGSHLDMDFLGQAPINTPLNLKCSFYHQFQPCFEPLRRSVWVYEEESPKKGETASKKEVLNKRLNKSNFQRQNQFFQKRQ